MLIKKKNEHFTLEMEMSEEEVQTIVGVFEQLCAYKNNPEMLGLRGEIYRSLTKTLKETT